MKVVSLVESEREPDSALVALRRDFPVLDQSVHGHPLIYFDNAATTQKPRAVIEAMTHFYEHDNANVHRGLHELSTRSTEAYEAARRRVALFINAPAAENVVFTRGTTEGINLLAHSFGEAFLEPGDTVLLTEMEHHANLVPWQMLARRKGVKLAFAPVVGDGEGLDRAALSDLLAAKPKLLAFTHISNTLGVINPVEEICAEARRHGVLTLVDAAQSSGHLPLDVQALGCDFLVFSSHKMCGPTGFGVFYGRAELLEQLPPWQGGGDMIAKVFYDRVDFKPPPERFEAGTPPIAEAIGLHAAMDYLDSIGRARIFHSDQEHAAYAYERLSALPDIRILGPRTGRSGLITFAFPLVHAHDVVSFADRQGIALRGGHHCNQPLMRKLGLASSARASFYFYNTMEEIDRLADVLRDTLAFFNRGL